MKKPKLAVQPYRHHPKYKFVLDLRPFGKGRKFFKTRTDGDTERRRRLTLLADAINGVPHLGTVG